MKIRRFNNDGLRKFEETLNSFRTNRDIDLEILDKLIKDQSFSEEMDEGYNLPLINSDSKYAISKIITEALQLDKRQDLYYDKGLWTWLSAFLLDKLVPYKKDSSTERDFKENALYILEPTVWNRYYRHLLAFPCWTYSVLQSKGKIFLRGAIYERGEIVEQLASVYDIQRNQSIVEAATILWYDESRDNIYKGAASKDAGGTARRFREVIQQFKLTFDLNSMSGAQIVSLLPFEFDRWKKAS